MLLLTIDETMQSSSFLIRLNKRFQYFFFQTVAFLEYALALLTFCTWTENPWRGSFCSLAPLPWAIWQLAAAATARPQAASLVWPPAPPGRRCSLPSAWPRAGQPYESTLCRWAGDLALDWNQSMATEESIPTRLVPRSAASWGCYIQEWLGIPHG